mgnify:FL=1|tara:strand:- start:680 stop:853 length:174 start_codon:yes stop_codon:yes gene_type:complete
MRDTLVTMIEKPLVGMSSSLGGAMINYFEILGPYLNFASVCVGLVVGLLTLKKLIKG